MIFTGTESAGSFTTGRGTFTGPKRILSPLTLLRFAQMTGVHIIATTDFHQPKFYLPNHWLWSASVEAAAAYFV